MNNKPTATGLPGQSGITNHISVPLPVRPAPAVPPVELYAAPTGKLFQLVGADPDGALLFIPAEKDPTTTARWLWAREDYLVDAFEGPLTRVERAA